MGMKAATITGIGAPNPRALHEVPVHDPKVRICCALCVRRIIRLAFFQGIINSYQYAQLILQLIL
jgi:hypothetical protein